MGHPRRKAATHCNPESPWQSLTIELAPDAGTDSHPEQHQPSGRPQQLRLRHGPATSSLEHSGEKCCHFPPGPALPSPSMSYANSSDHIFCSIISKAKKPKNQKTPQTYIYISDRNSSWTLPCFAPSPSTSVKQQIPFPCPSCQPQPRTPASHRPQPMQWEVCGPTPVLMVGTHRVAVLLLQGKQFWRCFGLGVGCFQLCRAERGGHH